MSIAPASFSDQEVSNFLDAGGLFRSNIFYDLQGGKIENQGATDQVAMTESHRKLIPTGDIGHQVIEKK